MFNRAASELRAARDPRRVQSARPWGGSGAAWPISRAGIGLVTSVTMLTLSTTMAFSQSTDDAFICADPSLTTTQIASFVSEANWDRSAPPKQDVMFAAIFLGNTGADEASMRETWNWAEHLLEATSGRDTDETHTFDNSTILLGVNSAEQRYCLFVSDELLMEQMTSRFPTARVVADGARTFLYYSDETIKVSASQLPQSDRPTEFHLPNQIQFTATFVASRSVE